MAEAFHLFRPANASWLGGEPRVHVVVDEEFPDGAINNGGAQIIELTYAGGGLTGLFDQIEAETGAGGSFQAMLEILEASAREKPLVLVVRNVTELLKDTGPAVLHFMAGWESFTHHGGGISPMYLILCTGPDEDVSSAFSPGGVIEWI